MPTNRSQAHHVEAPSCARQAGARARPRRSARPAALGLISLLGTSPGAGWTSGWTRPGVADGNKNAREESCEPNLCITEAAAGEKTNKPRPLSLARRADPHAPPPPHPAPPLFDANHRGDQPPEARTHKAAPTRPRGLGRPGDLRRSSGSIYFGTRWYTTGSAQYLVYQYR